MQDYKQLKIWENAHCLAVEIYKITSLFPKDEIYGITSQIRRASCSIPTNIVEGCGRETKPDFAHFLQISLGSTFELEYLIFLSTELGFINKNSSDEISQKILVLKKMISSFLLKIRKK